MDITYGVFGNESVEEVARSSAGGESSPPHSEVDSDSFIMNWRELFSEDGEQGAAADAPPAPAQMMAGKEAASALQQDDAEAAPMPAPRPGNSEASGSTDVIPRAAAAERAAPEQVPEVPRVGAAARTAGVVMVIPGHGELRFYPGTATMAVFCRRHECDCRRSSTCAPKKAGSSGRPIGFLVMWLQRAADFENKMAHVHSSVIRHEERVAARAHFQTLEGWQSFAEHEKPRADGDPDEPLRL